MNFSILIGWEQCGFFSKTVDKRVNSVQKEVKNQAFWLVNDQINSPMANEIFRFQIKHAPWMAQFFLDCVIHVHFFCLIISHFFMYIIKKYANVFSHTIWNK